MGNGMRSPLGHVFAVSLSRKTSRITRELVPCGQGNIKQSISVRMKARASRATKDPGLWGIIVRDPATAEDIQVLGGFLNRYFSENGRLLVGFQLLKDGKTIETWTPDWSQSFIESFTELERNRRRVETLESNGGTSKQIHFFSRLASMCENSLTMKTGIKTEATFALLNRELRNFMSGFDVWL